MHASVPRRRSTGCPLATTSWSTRISASSNAAAPGARSAKCGQPPVRSA